MAKIRLITRGDDAGSCVSADLALVECARDGILRNIGVMVPGSSFDHAVPLLKELEGVALGLHVCLNAEWDTVKWGPVLGAAAVPTLVDENGHFLAFPQQQHERGFSVSEAMDEVKAQLDKARKAGLAIAYLDEHMGVSWIGFREPLARLCEEEGLVDHTRYKYLRGASTATELLDLLKSTEPGTYVMVNHPGRDEEDMRLFIHPGLELGQVAKERDGDRRLWLDPLLRTAVHDGLFDPIRYDQGDPI